METNKTPKDRKKREVQEVIPFRPLDLAPIIQRWLDTNPKRKVSMFIREAICAHPDAKTLAGKRYAHLLEA